MATRNWRDVARLARMHKFDRFQKSNSKDENEDKNQRKKEEEKTATNVPQETKPMPSRFASMDFRRPNNNVDLKTSEQTKRSSWAAGNVDAEKRFSARPPPPPPPPKPAVKAEPPPLQSENKADISNTVPPRIPKKETATSSNEPESPRSNIGVDSENKVPFGTPGKPKLDSQRTSTPLQERTNIPVVEPPTTTKKATSKSKPFARLLKENGISYYEMLEIAEDASEKDILKAFRSWAKLVHPDHNKEPTATEDFQALQQIYETLRVPKTRLAYNCRQRIRRCAFGARPMSSARTTSAAAY